MALEYRNTEGNLITENQVQYLDEYKIFKKDDLTGDVKRIDIIENRKLKSIQYFISSEENENDVVNSLLNLAERSLVIKSKQDINNLKLYFNKQFNAEGMLMFKTNVLHDNQDYAICFQYLDINTNQPLNEKTTKFKYENGDLIFEASYNSNGSLESLIYMPTYDEQDWEAFDQNNFSELQAKFSEDISYYLTADLIP